MRIVVMGAGSVGSYIVSIMVDEGHDVLIIENNKEALDNVLADNDCMGIHGDGADPKLLREADVGDADFFISLSDSDEVNIVAANMAKVLGARRTVARVRSPKYNRNDEFMKNFLGVDYFINPEMLAAKQIELTLGYALASSVEEFFNARVQMIEFNIHESSKLVGKTLSELRRRGIIKNVLVTIVDRDGNINIPSGNFRLEAHDDIHVIGTQYDLRKLYLSEFGNKTDIKSSLLIGASRISYYLAKEIIDNGIRVKVIEINEERAVEFHNLLPKATVIHGDGASSNFLEEEYFREYDSIIALTGIDERNILIALIAEKADIREIITRVDNKDLLRVTGILDIDVTVTPIKEAANQILRYVRSKSGIEGNFAISSLYLLEDNLVEAIEFEVIEGSKIIGRPLKNLKIKDNIIIAAIYRSDSQAIILPAGDTSLTLHDRVIVITKHKAFTSIDDILEEG